jgi:PEP-CTERM motif/Domain of unknown function (DUF4114)
MNKALASLAAFAALVAANAQATPIRLDGSEMDLQDLMNGMTVGGHSSVNAVTEQYGMDQTWTMNSIFGGQSMIVMELAGYARVNRFGLYDVNDPTQRLQLFNGADSTGAIARFEIHDDGSVYRNSAITGLTLTSQVFGFYLETPVGLWYSQDLLNGDGGDHLVAYQGQADTIFSPPGGRKSTWGADQFLLGWEDLSARNWDQDYNDFVVFVGGVNGVNVPEPTTLGLLGLGLAGMAAFRRRKQA